MVNSCLLIVLFLSCLCLIKSQDVDLYPAIAMICGKNTQHRDLTTGEWITDPTGNKDCMDDVAEMLEYCRQVYPGLQITNVARQNTPVRISAWCAIGHAGSRCRGHRHSVPPVRCITADHNPTLVVKTGCSVVTISDESLCKGSSYWNAKAAERCQDEGKILNDQHNNVMPCNGVSKWRGIQFACCETKRPVPKFMNIDPICTQAKKSGVCRAAFDAWYFDTNSGSCTRFTYGGCGGNDNRFDSLQACQASCETNALIVDPLLNLGIGPEIPESTTETTTTSTQQSTLGQSSDSYFDAPLDPNSEQEMYSNAMMAELKEHQKKLSLLMDQWNSAKSSLLKLGASQVKGDLVDSDLQKEIAALRNEHQRKREQLNSAHQARMDAAIVGARTNSYYELNSELNKPDIQPSKVVRAFRRYLQSEMRDQHHSNKLLQHADDNSDEAQALNQKLATIQNRVNNALATTQLRLGPGDSSDKLTQLVSSLMSATTTPNVLHDDVMDDANLPSESDRPMLIDYGGLPPENVDNREEIDQSNYRDDGGDNEDEENDDFDDELFSNETPAPLSPEDFPQEMPNLPVPDYDLNEFSNELSEPMADSVKQWKDYEEPYNEKNWLLWLGVAGASLLLIVLAVAMVRGMGNRYNRRRQFARVEVEDQLTPEEKQLLQMQQNGYENPTYKFFEKQQQQQQA